MGQQAAQRLTSSLLPLLERASRQAASLPPQQLGSAAIGLALTSMAHERQYSRLFRS
jgi:urease accessory protein